MPDYVNEFIEEIRKVLKNNPYGIKAINSKDTYTVILPDDFPILILSKDNLKLYTRYVKGEMVLSSYESTIKEKNDYKFILQDIINSLLKEGRL